MIQSILKSAEVRNISVYTAAGTGDVITSSAIDMLGYESAIVLVKLGAVTAGGVVTLKMQQSDDDAAADAYSDIAGSALANVGNASTLKIMAVEILNPKKRYLKCLATRSGGQNVVIESITVLLFGAKVEPVALGATVDGSLQLVNPEEGTA